MKPLAGGAITDGTLALRFIANNPNVTVVIPGMAEEKEITENVAAVSDKMPLTAAEQEKIQRIRDELGTNFCRRCNYCQPCTAGINISFMLLLEGYYSRYDLKEWAAARYAAAEKKASDCLDCGVCESRCPYNLPIRQMLQNVTKVFGK